MNESILKALMRLFAIIANVNKDDVSSKSRTIVETYLKYQLSQELVGEYLNIFDEFLTVHHKDFQSNGIKAKKRTSLNSVKVLMICHEINEELQQKEKVIVLLRLLEFIQEEEIISDKELDFVTTVANTFNISENEYIDIKSFVLNDNQNISNKQNLLIIDSCFFDEDFAFTKFIKGDPASFKYIYEKNLSGKILVLRISSTNTYILKYIGDDIIYLNSQNVIPMRTYVFDHGSLIKSPKISPIYYSDIISKFIHSDSKSKIILHAKDIEFQFKNSENGIKRFNFYEESGHLIGIMGGSGVGKSTLLNLLIGNYPLKAGQIAINGYNLRTDKKHLEGVIGYVPQDDLLMEELTVFQNLYFNTKLSFSTYSEPLILKSVAKILSDLDLNEIRHLKVGNPLNKFISGGQRKRLNIALELLREPSILVADEPTSGLSSADSDMVMNLLKEQTLKGKLVIVNIHQPSSDIYKLFDKLIILDKGGYPVYYGNPIDAVVYFKTMSNHVNAEVSECPACGNVNPEQVLEIIEAKLVNEYGKLTRTRKVSPQEWYSLYVENIDSKITTKEIEKKTKLPENNFKIPNFIKQFVIFTLRDLLTKLENRQYLLINFLEAPALALILGYFSKYISGADGNPNTYVFSENENIVAYLFMCVIVALFLGLTVAAEEIIRDRKIQNRERFLNLSKFSYINSKVMIMFIISAIQTISFILIGNWILDIKDMTWYYWAILFSTAALANLIGLNISSALNSVVTIYITIPFILVPQLLFSGVIVNFNKLHKDFVTMEHVPAIGDIMTSRWAYEALTVVQFKENKYQKFFFDVEMKISIANYKSVILIPELQAKINNIMKNSELKQNDIQTMKEMKIVGKELKQLSKESGTNFNKVGYFTPHLFTEEVGIKAIDYLNDLKNFYSQKQFEANDQKDKIFNNLVKQLGSKEAVFQLKKEYHNKKLEEVLRNKQELDKFTQTQTRIIQITDPIYMKPLDNNGRAHFYAPVKKVGNIEIPTLWYNLAIIWIITFFLYIMLIKDLLRQFLNIFYNLNFSKKKKVTESF